MKRPSVSGRSSNRRSEMGRTPGCVSDQTSSGVNSREHQSPSSLNSSTVPNGGQSLLKRTMLPMAMSRSIRMATQS
jgi:hypothetical protein